MKNSIIYGLIGLMGTLANLSCSDFLDRKSDVSLLVPTTLDDCQYLLNDPYSMGYYTSTGFTDVLTDDYIVTYAQWSTYYNADAKGFYVWDGEAIPNSGRWDMYQTVYCANCILAILDEITPGDEQEQTRWNAIKGCALFFRAFAFYHVAQVYAPTYDKASATTDWGIPLRLSAVIDDPTIRSTVQETYDRVIMDLTDAVALLPSVALNRLMPDKAAGYAMLSRVYLMMRDYEQALTRATNSLESRNTLLDYNETTMFVRLENPEVLFPGISFAEALVYYYGSVHPDLYTSYADNDLRKAAYFTSNGQGGYRTGGTCSGSNSYTFTGLAVDEVYLTRAECHARAGDKTAALNDLNTLLRKRHDATFTDYTAASAEEALSLILKERRKELIFRGIRWSDIKRLNKEPEHAITLTRTFPDNPATYTLPPNDKRYVLLVPQEVIEKAGIPQTPR